MRAGGRNRRKEGEGATVTKAKKKKGQANKQRARLAEVERHSKGNQVTKDKWVRLVTRLVEVGFQGTEIDHRMDSQTQRQMLKDLYRIGCLLGLCGPLSKGAAPGKIDWGWAFAAIVLLKKNEASMNSKAAAGMLMDYYCPDWRTWPDQDRKKMAGSA